LITKELSSSCPFARQELEHGLSGTAPAKQMQGPVQPKHQKVKQSKSILKI
jgi:hypothetical protein